MPKRTPEQILKSEKASLLKFLKKIFYSDDYVIKDEGQYELVCPECVRKKELANQAHELVTGTELDPDKKVGNYKNKKAM